MELSFTFFKKFFLYFGMGILITVVYVEVEAYLEPWYIQNLRHIQSTVKHIRWNALKNMTTYFLSASSWNKKKLYFLIFRKIEVSSSITAFFLYFG